MSFVNIPVNNFYMKKFIKRHKYGLIMVLPGAILGYLYWHHIGCNTGTCPITSVWYNSSIYGAILGYLAGDLIDSYRKKKEATRAQSSQTTN